jgi:hypothetical protein
LNKLTIITLAILSFFLATAVNAATLFGYEIEPFQTIRIDTASQSITVLIDSFSRCQDLEMASSSTIYNVCDGDFMITDITTGSTTDLPSLSNLPGNTDTATALELTNNTLYAAFAGFGVKDEPGEFGMIDVSTSIVTSIGPMTGMGAPTGGLHDVEGTMYAVSAADAVDSSLFTIDVSSGAATLIAPLTLAGFAVNSVTALAYADGKMFTVINNDSMLYSIDLSTGELTPEFGLGVGISVNVVSLTVGKPPANQFSIDDGFIKLDTIGNQQLLDGECSSSSHYGRMVFDETGTGSLWVCSEAGWAVH